MHGNPKIIYRFCQPISNDNLNVLVHAHHIRIVSVFFPHPNFQQFKPSSFNLWFVPNLIIIHRIVSTKVMRHNRVDFPIINQHSIFQNDTSLTKRFDTSHIMANKEHRSPFSLAYILHFSYGFLLEFGIAHGKHLVHYKDLGVQMCSHGETKTNLHSAGITLNRRINIPFTATKRDDFIQLFRYLLFSHTQNGSIHINILPSSQFRMEARSHL